MRCDWVEGVSNHEQTFRRLAIRDDAFVDFLLGDESANLAASTLDAKTHALVRLGPSWRSTRQRRRTWR